MATINYPLRNQLNVHGSVRTLNMYTTADKSQKEFPFSFGILNGVSSFRGREEEVDRLECLFNTSKIVVLHGLGGYGKTQLARHYAELRREKYSGNLVWIKGETEDYLKGSFRDVALDLKISDHKDREIKSVILEVYNYFKRTRVLFIIDNAQDKQSIVEFLPSSFMVKDADIHVLITSQCTRWGDIPELPLKGLSQKHALQVLSAIIGEDMFNSIPKAQWEQLADTFYCIPLGLQIAAGYVKQRLTSSLSNDFSILKYIARIQEKNMLFDNKLPVDSDSTYEKSIYNSLYFTAEKIKSSSEDESKWALDLINVCSYLNPDEITDELLLKLRVIGGSVDKLEEALAVLEQYSLIISKERCTYGRSAIRVHRLVQMFFRYHQERNQTVVQFYQDALQTVTCMSSYWYYTQGIHVLEHTNYLKILLESLMGPEAKAMIEDWKLLHVASYAVQPDAMRLLLQHGANVNSLRTECQPASTPLLLLTENLYYSIDVARNRLEDAIRLLLDHNANITDRNFLGRNVLHFVARWRCSALIDHILDKGQLNVDVQDEAGCTPLHFVSREEISNEAEVTRAKECIRLMVASRKGNINAKDVRGRSILHYTAIYGNWHLIEFLIDTFGMDSDMRDRNGNSPLHWINTSLTARSENEIHRIKKTIEVLVARGASVNAQNEDNTSILHLVTGKKCVPLIDYLINNYPVDVNVRNRYRCTPLHFLAENFMASEAEMTKSKELVCTLVQRGADINATDLKGTSILSYAASSRNVLLVAYLLEEHQVDVNQQDDHGRTPLFWTVQKEIVDDSDQERVKATINLLVSKNANPALKDNKGRTMLHYCALALSSQLLEFIIDQCHLHPDEQDNDGFTALHIIANTFAIDEEVKKKTLSCTEILRSRGARVDLVNNTGSTPAHLADNLRCSYLTPFLK